MTLKELEKLICKDESITLEFKKSTGQLKGAIETICAYLNTKGGIVIIGVNQHKTITGQNVTDNTQQEIANEIAKIEPFPESVKVEYYALPGKKDNQLITISTEKGTTTPYTYDGRSYYRNETSTMRMPQSRYSQLLLERSFHAPNTWDTQYAGDATINDLDLDEIMQTVKIAVNVNRLDSQALNESPKDILEKLQLMRENKLTNAALILFGKSIDFITLQCGIKLARFRGIKSTDDFIDNQIVYGNAFKIINSANDFILKHLNIASFFDINRFERIDVPTLPAMAVREAVCNAICHKEYLFHSTAITLAIFDDRVEIWNNGSLPSPLKIKDLKKIHKSYQRNKNIAHVFYLRYLIESWGTGTTKMMDLCRQFDIPDPVFEEYSGGLCVTFKFKEKIGPYRGKSDNKKNTISTPAERYEKILNLLKNSKPLSVKEIEEKLAITVSLRTIKRDLLMLKKQNLVQQAGKGKNILWQIVK